MRPLIFPAMLLGALLPIVATASAMPAIAGAVGPSSAETGSGMVPGLGTCVLPCHPPEANHGSSDNPHTRQP